MSTVNTFNLVNIWVWLTTDFHLGADTYVQIHKYRVRCVAKLTFPKITFLHAGTQKKKTDYSS